MYERCEECGRPAERHLCNEHLAIILADEFPPVAVLLAGFIAGCIFTFLLSIGMKP